MSRTAQLMKGVCVAAVMSAGLAAANAQQTVAPVSATPLPGPMPEVLAGYSAVTAERLRIPGKYPEVPQGGAVYVFAVK